VPGFGYCIDRHKIAVFNNWFVVTYNQMSDFFRRWIKDDVGGSAGAAVRTLNIYIDRHLYHGNISLWIFVLVGPGTQRITQVDRNQCVGLTYENEFCQITPLINTIPFREYDQILT
jgi:hypothetical protein